MASGAPVAIDPAGRLRAYWVDDDSIYAAETAEHAAALCLADTGEACEAPFPELISEAELDAPRPDFDEDERPTGTSTTIRAWLLATTKPGWLAGSI